MNRFQIILIAIFSFAAVFGVFLFATFRGNNNELTTATIWGTMRESDFATWYSKTPLFNDHNFVLNYEFKQIETFDNQFIEALADGRGPDIIFLPHNKILKYKSKIFPIPYDTLSERDFRDTFIEGSEIYLGEDGIYALPFAVDPLVMYWNRDIFRNAGISEVPKYWDEFPDLALDLTEFDPAQNISQSAVALGEYQNINRADAILSALLMQAGTPITENQGSRGIKSVLPNAFDFVTAPADAALTFYTQFANPAKNIHTWNRAFSSSLNTFASGDLAIMFGLSSDLFSIQDRNPNLNFDVAPLPQPREVDVLITYGEFHGFALVKQSRDLSSAYRMISALTSKDSLRALSETLKLPPVRRDLLKEKPNDAYLSVFYDSALISRAWLSPEPRVVDQIFGGMVSSITSGRLRLNEAIRSAHNELDRALGGSGL